jgi:hypothetical protein
VVWPRPSHLNHKVVEDRKEKRSHCFGILEAFAVAEVLEVFVVQLAALTKAGHELHEFPGCSSMVHVPFSEIRQVRAKQYGREN